MDAMTKAEQPAYPASEGEHTLSTMGLTKREVFVKAAMQSILLINGAGTYGLANNIEDVCRDIAQAAIRVADETLKQLEK